MRSKFQRIESVRLRYNTRIFQHMEISLNADRFVKWALYNLRHVGASGWWR